MNGPSVEQRLLRQERRETDYAEQMRHHLGPAMALFEDPDVAEVYVNPGAPRVWVESRKLGRRATGLQLEPDRIRAFLNTVADRERETLGISSAHIAAQLPLAYFEGARLQGLLPRVVASPCFVIRKRPDRVYPLAEYLETGMMTAVQYAAILRAIEERKNILVAGGTGSGKTTLVNAILKGMMDSNPEDRFVILEDTPELQCEAADQCSMQTTLALDLADLVKLTLRTSPDRIIVGEVRDEAALHLMDGWVTGHPGGAGTVHATTAQGALRRMERLARRAANTDHSELVAEAIDLVVLIAGTGRSRKVTDVVRVESELDAHGHYQVRPAGREAAGMEAAGTRASQGSLQPASSTPKDATQERSLLVNGQGEP